MGLLRIDTIELRELFAVMLPHAEQSGHFPICVHVAVDDSSSSRIVLLATKTIIYCEDCGDGVQDNL